VNLAHFLSLDAIGLDIPAAGKEAALDAVTGLLTPQARARDTIRRLLGRRELLGSTAVGRGIAIPHCRSLAVPRLRMAYARLAKGLDWDSLDREPVRHLFLIVAPPVEVSNLYLAVVARLAQIAREPGFSARLDAQSDADGVLKLLQG
jgi:mannitol/fructose-specific phosphotransferase system IIA component (Ntr-type)